MKNADSAAKITARHLARKAVVYLRQSSIAQVRQRQESQRLQYALKDTAKRLRLRTGRGDRRRPRHECFQRRTGA